ncbi:MAG: sigma-54 dependent transcriptional regulator [Bacteroidales bacterium]|nr:sigma-54 dependent transcriptional regulator [Bacteroidales bacterium]
MRNKIEVRILTDDKFLANKIEFELSQGTNWNCSVRYGVETELENKDNEVAAVILIYDFVKLSPEHVLQKLKTNYPNSKGVLVVPDEVIRRLRNLLLDVYISDVIRDNDILLLSMLKNHVQGISIDFKMRSRLESLSQWENGVFLSNDAVMARPKEMIRKAADSEINVSIYGETGTGKEVAARRIHSLSARANGPFVAVNVSAIPNDLVESAFFGHEKGSFTGAMQRKIGFFEAASGGTLFLDEIGDMDINMQTKLLRALQERVITRVGGTREIKIDVRLITATHVDLQKSVCKGMFREDLYYRLLGLNIQLPRLCERKEDLLSLADCFIKDYCIKSKKALCRLSKEAKSILQNYSFPGNIRELKAMMELAVVLCEDNVIKADDLSLRKEVMHNDDLFSVERTMEEYEEIIIKHYLDKYNGKVRLVAEKLDISKSKIYNFLQESKQ